MRHRRQEIRAQSVERGLARRFGVVGAVMVALRCGKSPEKMKVAVQGKWEEVKGTNQIKRQRGSRTPKN
jgi:hypothetical protein